MRECRLGAKALALLLALLGCGSRGGKGEPKHETPTPPEESCADSPLRTTGTVHYFCDCQDGHADGCQAGSNSADGLTPETARQTFVAAVSQFNAMDAGDTVAFCRGGAWKLPVGLDVSNQRCTAANTCDLRDYAPTWGAGAGNPRPILFAPMSVDRIFSLSTEGQRGMRFWNLDSRIPGTGGAHLFVYADMRDLDVCNWSMQGGYAGIDCQPTGTTDSKITIRDNQISSTEFAGFFGGAPGIRIVRNTFQDNGLRGDESAHSAYLISHCPDGSYTPYCGDESSVNSSDASAPLDFTFSDNHVSAGPFCGGAMLVVHGTFLNSRLVIQNNLIETTSADPACYGIMFSGGNSGAYFTGARVERNRVFAPGNAIEVSCCEGCTVSSNITMGGQFVISDSPCGRDFMGASGTYQNNTVYQSDALDGIRIGALGAGPYHLDSNAVWTNGSACLSGDRRGGRDEGNYCRAAGGPALSTVFADATNATPALASFVPATSSPLIGAGSSAHYAATAIGTATWSSADAGVSRSPPVDAGAMRR